MSHSLRPGMGAILYNDGHSGGTTFRVWAPHASGVWVCGSFNGWSTSSHPLHSENNGYWSADIVDAREDDRYKYFIRGPFVPGGHWRTDPYCREVLDNHGADGVIVRHDDFDWDNEVFQMPPWNELVVYELHIASFNRTQSVPGNFSTILDKLSYLKELGVNAIELMPIFGVYGEFSLGYNPAYPFDIESSYGHPDDFKSFIKEAHRQGFAIIMDVVYNHLGPEELDQSLRRIDGWRENNGDGVYFYNDWRNKTDFGSRPDFGRAAVRDYIRDNAIMWLDEYHVDGLRFDSTVNIRNVWGKNNEPAADLREGWELMQRINSEAERRWPWKIKIAEDLQHDKRITNSVGQGGAGFDAQWDSTFHHHLHQAIVAHRDEDRSMLLVKEAIEHSFDGNPFKKQIYINNHDECGKIKDKFRLSDQIWMGNADSWVVRKRYTLAAAIVFTSPGIPLLFQGDEFLEWGQWSDDSTLDWSKRGRFTGIWDLYQSLIRLRRNWFDNTRGLKGPNVHVFHPNDNAKVIAYHRWHNGGSGDDVVVVANFSNRAYDSYTIGFPRGGAWHVRFNSDWSGFSPDFGNHPGYNTMAYEGWRDNMPFTGNIGIGPYSALILSQ
jgi:1,4-alpha-glucan branching enzyme